MVPTSGALTFETECLLWHEVGPVVEHPEEIKVDLWNRISALLVKGEANAVPTFVSTSLASTATLERICV